MWASGLGVDPVAVYSGCFSAFTGVARMLNPVPSSPAGEDTLSSSSQRGMPQLHPSLHGPCGRPKAPQADKQESDRLLQPGASWSVLRLGMPTLAVRPLLSDPGKQADANPSSQCPGPSGRYSPVTVCCLYCLESALRTPFCQRSGAGAGKEGAYARFPDVHVLLYSCPNLVWQRYRYRLSDYLQPDPSTTTHGSRS